MENSGFENRRNHPRAKEDLIVSVVILNSPEEKSLIGRKHDCLTKDISFQGICLRCDLKIPLGTELELNVHINDPPCAFTFEGIVIWSKSEDGLPGYESGIQFPDISGIPDGWKMLVINLLAESSNS
ncbi:MAG: PilZ protein [Gammaproteobacteria bacterium]|nr:PilZ protein [Gammaproteobacteria bacterium]